ncbi:hypothetical protein CNMCM5623_000572 [Aspergillus felis]|uniref:ABC transporter domain-containing protein n=1 Tax=Aspergillus felis TaxID=1287682 RepID=A0A8H6UY95_9EURO|nr:hypothetical protein CNMCM5623_000572 [Aspergillus felis]
MSLVVASIFFDTPDATAGFFAKGSLLFFATLLNALISVTEINSLYDQRPIVEKQASYAFVYPFAEAFGGIIADLPIKLLSAVLFNVIIYFLGSLRYTASQFFIFFLFSFLSTMIMSAVIRTLAAMTRSVAQAMALAGLMILIIVIYAGFVIPAPEMHPWFSWLRWINPLFYTFESLISNEFHGRRFECSQVIPGYPSLSDDAFICSVPGYSHEWRNLGILIGFWMFFTCIYLLATEMNSATSSTAEFLDTEKTPTSQTLTLESPAENGEPVDLSTVMPEQRSIFTWQDLCYDIPVKGGQRRLLDHVDGWVKPGTLTALMGVSGAGKTTLLDVLAQRVSIGVVTGDMLVNGGSLPASFQRQTGYVQQQNLHLATSTVREGLRFSAMLRQPESVSKAEKELTVDKLADAILVALEPSSRQKAQEISEVIQQGSGTKAAISSFHHHLQDARIRCALGPSRAAVWWLKDREVGLRAFAMTALVEAGLIKVRRLELYRSEDYGTARDPGTPLSALVQATLGSIAKGVTDVGDISAEILAVISGQRCRKKSGRKPHNIEAEAMAREISASSGDPSATLVHAPSLVAAAGDPTMREEKRYPSKFTQWAPKAAARTEHLALRVLDIIVIPPMDISLTLSRGFHNVSLVFHDNTVRDTPRVTGMRTGLKAAGTLSTTLTIMQELIFGVYDGVTGLVTLPRRGLKDSGAKGQIRGVGNGVGGFLSKPLAAAYPLAGLHKHLKRSLAKGKQGPIKCARIAQGT